MGSLAGTTRRCRIPEFSHCDHRRLGTGTLGSSGEGVAVNNPDDCITGLLHQAPSQDCGREYSDETDEDPHRAKPSLGRTV